MRSLAALQSPRALLLRAATPQRVQAAVARTVGISVQDGIVLQWDERQGGEGGEQAKASLADELARRAAFQHEAGAGPRDQVEERDAPHAHGG